MTWLSYVFFGITTAGFIAYGRNPPASDYTKVGSWDSVRLSNATLDSVYVYAIAPEVDNQIRGVGVLGPLDTTWFRLPYADTKVRLLFFGTGFATHMAVK
jgi:hypothetical protein